MKQSSSDSNAFWLIHTAEKRRFVIICSNVGDRVTEHDTSEVIRAAKYVTEEYMQNQMATE